MDYDTTEIPDVYDRGRDHGPEVIDLWMNVVSSYVDFPLTASTKDFRLPPRASRAALW